MRSHYRSLCPRTEIARGSDHERVRTGAPIAHERKNTCGHSVMGLRIRKRGCDGYTVAFYSSNFTHRSTLSGILEELIANDNDLLVVVIGDSNVNFRPRDASEGSSFLSHGYKHVVDGITRRASETCIDHIAVGGCNDFLDMSAAIRCTPLFLDHYPVLVTLSGRASLLDKADE